jgi:hypothetical protein
VNLLPVPRSVRLDGPPVPASNLSITFDAALAAEGYRLIIGTDGVRIVAADEAGAFYARATLEQLRRGSTDGTSPNGVIPSGTVEDSPDLAVRAVMLDVSRDKVPTMETLRGLIDRLAGWKVNQVQLYMEHTFAYRDHEIVWADADPLTAAEVRELDGFCRARHIELVPNQNCLGHMDRWLRHERYRPLAITPDGFTDIRGRHHAPTTVQPAAPESLALFDSLLQELLPNFTSQRVNVGLDEPWELTPDRIGDYVEHLRLLRALPVLNGREMIVWGDILAMHPDVLAALPDGVTVCEWGYEANHPFAERCQHLAKAGRSFWTAPGTSAWLTLAGRTTNMIGNIDGAVAALADYGGLGVLNTDWGDHGHLQQLPVSDPGFAYGAAVSWCRETNHDLDLAAALSAHCYDDPTGRLGRAVTAMGDANRQVKPQLINESILAMPVYHPTAVMGRGASGGLTVEDLERVAAIVGEALDDVDTGVAASGRPDAGRLGDELHQTGDILLHCGRDQIARLGAGGRLGDVPGATRRQLASALDALIERHRQLWLGRNRPGGLDDSVSVLAGLRAAYDGDTE